MAAINATSKKSLGSFYTSEPIVRLLVSWGMRRPHEVVMDPSCGDGRFLIAAAASGATETVGVDIDPAAIARANEALSRTSRPFRVIESDFFEILPDTLPPVDLVIGNPPFIRYQRFSGDARRRALESALMMGVKLTRLTSSWAPFLLHAVRFLRPGGEMAMVVPAEITQTDYGLATLRGLARHFGVITLLAFERNLFEDAQEETYLLLATDRGGSCEQVAFVPVRDAADAVGVIETDRVGGVSMPVEPHAGDVRFAEALLAADEREAWDLVKKSPGVVPIESIGSVTNGYVSGDNDFFHWTKARAAEAGLPDSWLCPSARSSRVLRGLAFTPDDVEHQERGGRASHLVVPKHDLFSGDPEALQRFTADGKKRGVESRFKCRTRDPWWKVPGLNVPDVFVTYMAGAHPRAAVNRAGAVYSNSLHGVRLAPGHDPEAFVLGWYTSAALLSLEIEGRSYGGGILKVEPREMLRVRLPCVASVPTGLAARVDALLRSGRYKDASDTVDEALLVGLLGFREGMVATMRSARERLMNRRLGRSRKAHVHVR